jgi:D-glycero-alpha-D-manno-heptose-7-phosphate kinase
MIISRTPYRISFFGGGTDYPAWFRNHGGAVLATTINKYCYLTCRYLPPFFEHRIRLVYSKIESCQSVEEIAHPAVREILRYLDIDRGVEIHHDGDLPARSGMGSSSAFVVGLLHALYALKGHMVSKRQLARESIHIEQERLKETVGSQDQISAAYGGFNQITFSPEGEFSVTPMTLSRERAQDLNSHLMLFYTGIKRTAANVAEGYVNEIESRKRQLRIMKDLVQEGVSILNSGRDIAGFGELLHEAWEAKRSLSTKVSNSQVDEIYDEARAAGAVGGKLTGAGGGGFLLLFAPLARHGEIRERLNRLIHVPFRLEGSGSQIIFFDAEEDYAFEEKARQNQSILPFQELSQTRP